MRPGLTFLLAMPATTVILSPIHFFPGRNFETGSNSRIPGRSEMKKIPGRRNKADGEASKLVK